MAIYITVCSVHADGASPVPTVHHGENANTILRTTQERPLRKNEIVELCEAFHLRTGEVRIQSPQSLMLQKSKSVA